MKKSLNKFLVSWLVLTAAAGAFGAVPEVQRPLLHGHHVLAGAAQLVGVGRMASSEPLELTIGLPLRNQAELTNFLADIYDPASPNYRHFLTPQQFTEQFGPTTNDYAAVIAYAQANGFTVTDTDPGRVLVSVRAPVATVEKAFHVAMRRYRHPKQARDFFAPDTEPTLNLAVPIQDISGLDDYIVPEPVDLKITPEPVANDVTNGDPIPLGGSSPSGNYAGGDFRAAYAPGVTLTGAGQYCGLIEFGGYYSNDIVQYEKQYMSGHLTPIINVLLNGQNVTNNASAEEALDIEMQIAMAPGLNGIYYYWGTGIDSMLSRIASDNVVRQVSASWSYGTTGNTDSLWQQLSAQGISFFNSSGDSDAHAPGTSINNSCSSPYVTSVGGTTLTTSGPVGSWVSEKVWNTATATTTGDGSSGGWDPDYSLPVWQQGISMTANLGSTIHRNIPDVALTGSGIAIIFNGGGSVVGGTSCSAPLWAGFTALVNQQAAANGAPPVGLINAAVYALGKGTNYATLFHDITTGNNFDSGSPTNFPAVAGYDLCTGWGTPRGLALINALAIPVWLRPDTMVWNAPANITSALDVATLGTTLYAYDLAGINQTVNGVNFVGSSSVTSVGTNVRLTGFMNTNINFTTTSNPYAALATAYKNILTGGDFTNASTTATVTLQNLVSGHTYLLQVWVEDPRIYGVGRTLTVSSASSRSQVTLDYNSTDAVGGIGQYAIGVFTASDTNYAFTLVGGAGSSGAATQMNALQVRDVTGYNWSGWSGFVDGNWNDTTTNWSNGKTFGQTLAFGGDVNFTDTNFFGATITNNLISIQAAGVSANSVNFLNNTVAYTLQNVSGGTNGITGTMAVDVSGNGRVTFTGTNTYTGNTTVNSGTLALSGSGSIASSPQLFLNGGVFDVSALGSYTVNNNQPITFSGGSFSADGLTLNGAQLTNTVLNATVPLFVVTNLTFGATASSLVIPTLSGFPAYPVQVPLIQYGTLNNSPNLALSLPTGYVGYLSNNVANNSIDLVLTFGGGPQVPLAWSGNVGGTWDILATKNWVNRTNSSSAEFYQDNVPVTFDDSVAGLTSVNLTAIVSPASVTVSNNAVNYTISGNGQLNGPTSLIKQGSGTLTLSSTNHFAGGMIINNGTVQLNAPTGAGSGAITNGGILKVNIGNNTLNNAISGAGSINVLAVANAQTTFAGSLSNFTGSLSVPASSGSSKVALTSGVGVLNSIATVTIANGGTLFASGVTIPGAITVLGVGNSENFGALRVDSSTVSGAVTLAGNTTVGTAGANNATISGNIGDGGNGFSLTKVGGTGALTLSGRNTYTGATVVTNGTVNVTGNESAATGSWLLSNNVALATVNFQAGSTVIVAATNRVQLGSWPAASSSAYQTLNGYGTVTNNGLLLVARTGDLELNSGLWVQNGGLTNSPPAGSGYSSALQLDAGSTFIYNGSSPIFLSPSSGSSGNTSIALGGGKFVTGQSFVNSVASSTGLSVITIALGGTLAFSANVSPVMTTVGSTNFFLIGPGIANLDNGGYNVTFTNAIGNIGGNVGSLNVTNTGTITLAGANTYSGPTTVGAGTLIVNGSLGTNSVTVFPNATLGGTGVIGGAVTVNGSIAPGSSNSVGTLTTGDETWNGGGAYVIGLNNATNNVGNDLLNLNGVLTVTATAGSPFSGGNTFKLKLVSLTSSNTPGAIPGFVSGQNASWTIATASGGITGFNATAFTIDLSSFSNAFSGTFAVTTNGNALVLAYTAPLVVAPVSSGAPSFSNGAFNFSFSGPSGQTYEVLATTNLALPLTNWLVLTNGVFGSGVVNYTDTAATNGQEYYEVTSP